MSDALEMIVAGRVMLLLTECGVRDARCLDIYCRAVLAVVRQHRVAHPCVPLAECDRFVGQQIGLLEQALRRRRVSDVIEPAAGEGLESVVCADATATVPTEPPRPAADLVAESGGSDAQDRPERQQKAATGYVPEVKTREEKLKEERVPVQKLLLEDCVAAGLVDVPTAKRLVAGMTGKTSQAAEGEIVEYLRGILQQQVRAFIRKARGGPWADPRTQEDLRKDIHAAKSVRSVLMLRRQVAKEHEAWEQKNGRGGLLGLLSARRRLAGS